MVVDLSAVNISAVNTLLTITTATNWSLLELKINFLLWRKIGGARDRAQKAIPWRYY
jgi:hypothetical protein